MARGLRMPSFRTYILNIVLAFIPDFLVCWAVMKLTDDEWRSFWIALLALQAIYFLGEDRGVVVAAFLGVRKTPNGRTFGKFLHRKSFSRSRQIYP